MVFRVLHIRMKVSLLKHVQWKVLLEHAFFFLHRISFFLRFVFASALNSSLNLATSLPTLTLLLYVFLFDRVNT